MGAIPAINSDGSAIAYYVIDIVGSTIQISDSQGGDPIGMSTQTGSMRIYRGAFAVAQQPDSVSPLTLSDATGSMTAIYGNDRMAIWSISIDSSDVVSLTLSQQTVYNDYVTSTQGQKYSNGTYLYYPLTPIQTLSRVSWTNLIIAQDAVTQETTFDHNSVQWIDPVDMYDPTDAYDKYLVFPKVNILQ